jgi:hypothetical protein
MAFFFSFLKYFEEYISESSTEIATEVHWHLWKTSMKEMIEDRRCR